LAFCTPAVVTLWHLRLNSRELAMRPPGADAQDRGLEQPSATGGPPTVIVALSRAANKGQEATPNALIHARSE